MKSKWMNWRLERSMGMDEAKILLNDLVFGEGPRWHRNKLWFSDMHGGVVKTLDLEGHCELVVEVPHKPSGLGFLPDGRLLIASMEDRKVLRLDKDGLKLHCDLTGYATGSINDMIVDGKGNAYVGQFGSDTYGGEPMKDTSLILVTPDGASREVAFDLRMPNGMAISPDGKTLYLAETYRHCLTMFYIEEDGSLSNREVFAEVPLRPDGICLDAEGCIWMGVAMHPEGCFLRVAKGGEIVDKIELEDWRGIACVHGGPDRQTLFLLEAQRASPSKIEGPGNARIRIMHSEVPGAGLP